MFRGKGCGYCRAFLNFLNDNAEEYGKYFKLVSFETWYDENNGGLLTDVSTFLGEAAQGVPYVIIGDQVFPGYASSYDDGIKSAITELYKQKPEDRYDVFKAYNDGIDAEKKAANASTNKVIIWNFVFVLIATVVIVLVIKSAENNILGELRDTRSSRKDASKYKEVVNLDTDEEPKKPSPKKRNGKRK
jgi:thiol-disulfide isomerase/thioredoxin